MSINHTFGLNLRVLSFNLPREIVKESDDIRVSITTIPEENKQAFVISARKMKDSNLTFGVNINIPQEELPEDFITTGTEKIIVVFRKKSFFNSDPIIASTTIESKEFPRNLSEAAQTKIIRIFEPATKNNRNNKTQYSGLCEIPQTSNKIINRRVIGTLQIQMSLTDPFHLHEFKTNNINNDELYDISNDTTGNKHNYTNDLFKIGQNHFRFRVLD